ncbi:hypothetical protein BAUCODRAFT_134158 [Baudoinia panamericana UAMH 10762]|uniref:Uncharacterized protein n=1 Tax=Baudoinia panamericana (strain UAMH 10762) TaxID=717646 RepID=M2N025_BAUPA|nr:uncharacterized protein BAUCODRAFT_134158 [Baudoinia panamericana UAMH 10762]EMC92279.1 hypothetical protein BAUCODRAFT_134158 [Baudoinia panamericana UAMH 10762]
MIRVLTNHGSNQPEVMDRERRASELAKDKAITQLLADLAEAPSRLRGSSIRFLKEHATSMKHRSRYQSVMTFVAELKKRERDRMAENDRFTRQIVVLNCEVAADALDEAESNQTELDEENERLRATVRELRPALKTAKAGRPGTVKYAALTAETRKLKAVAQKRGEWTGLERPEKRLMEECGICVSKQLEANLQEGAKSADTTVECAAFVQDNDELRAEWMKSRAEVENVRTEIEGTGIELRKKDAELKKNETELKKKHAELNKRDAELEKTKAELESLKRGQERKGRSAAPKTMTDGTKSTAVKEMQTAMDELDERSQQDEAEDKRLKSKLRKLKGLVP